MYKSGWMKIQMFLSSLMILFIMLFFLNLYIPLEFGENSKFIGFSVLFRRNIISIICAILCFISIVFTRTFNFKISSGTQEYFVVKKIRSKNYEHLTFLATYIIPLITFDLEILNQVITLVVLLIVIGMIYIKTDIYYANPTLAILNYHLYEADIELRDEKTHEGCILISRDRITVESNLEYLRLDDCIYFVKPKETRDV